MKITEFDLTQTFECGQCFRWKKTGDNSYTGVAMGKVLTVSQQNDDFEFENDKIWEKYFDIGTDYKKIQNELSGDSIMKSAIAKGSGIRILKQDFFETLISFIISQNNNIPRIKKIVESLCEKYGKHIKDGYFSFPTSDILCGLEKEDLAFLRAGYRDGYIIDAAQKVYDNQLNMDIVRNAPIDEARAEISKVKGVGPKVADCVLLFGAGRTEVFPTDVWIKKVLSHYYGFENYTSKQINAFAGERFGIYAGYAQQYLFYMAREDKIEF